MDKPIKPSQPALKKYLKQLNPEQLTELIIECCGINKDIERFLSVKVLGEEVGAALFSEYRKKVVDEFFPQRGNAKLRLKEAKKAISDYEKLTGDSKRALELKVIYVESGIEFIRAYGFIGNSLYNSLVTVFYDVVQTINDSDSEELFKEYEQRLIRILHSSAGLEWGFMLNFTMALHNNGSF